MRFIFQLNEESELGERASLGRTNKLTGEIPMSFVGKQTEGVTVCDSVYVICPPCVSGSSLPWLRNCLRKGIYGSPTLQSFLPLVRSRKLQKGLLWDLSYRKCLQFETVFPCAVLHAQEGAITGPFLPHHETPFCGSWSFWWLCKCFRNGPRWAQTSAASWTTSWHR